MGDLIKKSDGLKLGSLGDVLHLAESLVKAGDFVPSHFKGNASAVAAAILTGKELGLAPMASLRGLYVAKGKVGVTYDTIIGLLMREGYKIRWIKTDESIAEVELTHPNKTVFVLSYTVEQAKKALIMRKDRDGKETTPWYCHRAAMLRARCISNAARAFAGGVLAGIYCEDEIQEIAREEKVVKVKADPRSGNATLMSAINASSEVKPVDDDKSLEVANDEADVVHEVVAESESFSEMYTMIDTSKNKDELETRGGIIKCHTGLTAEEKEILREKYRNKMADMEAKDDE